MFQVCKKSLIYFFRRRRPTRSTRTYTLCPYTTRFRAALLQSGMDDYLTKPISERQLSQVVLKWTGLALRNQAPDRNADAQCGSRSEEHTTELQSLMRNSYAVFCLKKKQRD